MHAFNPFHVPLLFGSSLIEANAGTGKTFSIEVLFLRLLLEKEIPITEILVVTYTNAACAEIKSRLLKRLYTAKSHLIKNPTEQKQDDFASIAQDVPMERQKILLVHALLHFDEVSIHTIHGFCQKTLKEFPFETGESFNIELLSDEGEILSEIAADFWRGCIYQDKTEAAFYMSVFKKPENLLKNYRGKDLNRPICESKPGKDEVLSEIRVLSSLYDSLLLLWQKHRTEIETIFLSHPGLKRNSFRKSDVFGRMKKMDTLLEARFFLNGSRDFSLPDQKNFKWFLPKTLEEKSSENATSPQHPFFDSCQSLILQQVKTEKACGDYFNHFVTEKREISMRSGNFFSFDDLIKRLWRALSAGSRTSLVSALRKKYQAAFIDEFQDTDPIQYNIFSKIFDFAESRLFFIGDPKQAIYRFRGADVNAYIHAKKEVKRSYSLLVNYRSDPNLVEGINQIFQAQEDPFLQHNAIPFTPSKGLSEKFDSGILTLGDQPISGVKINYLELSSEQESVSTFERQITQRTVHDVLTLLRPADGQVLLHGNPVVPKDIVILTRTNAQAAEICRVLTQAGVPTLTYNRSSLFHSDEFRELVSFLKAVISAGNVLEMKKALSLNFFGYTAFEIEALEHLPEYKNLTSEFFEYKELWEKKGLAYLLRIFMQKRNITERFLLQKGGERRVTNLFHLIEILNDLEYRQKRGIRETFRRIVHLPIEFSDEEKESLRPETDIQVLRVMTIHASKGLEFPIVFCPFLWQRENTKPLKDSEESKQENFEEGIRRTYVALTRAAQFCSFYLGQVKKMEESVLSYLLFGAETPSFEGLQKKFQGSTGITIEKIDEVKTARENYNFSNTIKLKDTERSFTHAIPGALALNSFTSLASGRPFEGHFFNEPYQNDEFHETEDEVIAKNLARATVFPPGKNTGIFFHSVLEQISWFDYEPQKTREIIAVHLASQGIDQKWISQAENIIENLVKATLIGHNGEKFSLPHIAADKIVREMEFCIPLDAIHNKKFTEIIHDYRDPQSPYAVFIDEMLKNCYFTTTPGVLQGFIDFIFEYQDRYYLIDWKTNLILSKNAYELPSLCKHMRKHLYFLQYILYAVILNKYLKKKRVDYSFCKHFGGVYYLFLRGLNPGKKTGIFYDSLEGAEPMLDALENYFIPKENNV